MFNFVLALFYLIGTLGNVLWFPSQWGEHPDYENSAYFGGARPDSSFALGRVWLGCARTCGWVWSGRASATRSYFTEVRARARVWSQTCIRIRRLARLHARTPLVRMRVARTPPWRRCSLATAVEAERAGPPRSHKAV